MHSTTSTRASVISTTLVRFRNYMFASTSEKPKLAFLGPLGTYSHQAAYECFGETVSYLAQPTIADVQQTLSASVPFGLIPQENSINGSVVETYNLLRIPAVGIKTFVRGFTSLGIQHSLVVRQGVKIGDIEHVLSHEQALGQCRSYLAEHLPRAILVPTDSTASAAERLLSVEPGGLNPSKCAAICSSVVVTIYKGLEVLQQGIQDGEVNFTRFYILSYEQDVNLPVGHITPLQEQALLRVQSPSDDSVPTLDITKIFHALDVNILRIDRRPSLRSMPFDDVYFLEIGVTQGDHDKISSSWPDQLHLALDKIKGTGAEVSVLGLW